MAELRSQSDYSIFGAAINRLRRGESVDAVLAAIDAERSYGTVPLARRRELVGEAVASLGAERRAGQPYEAFRLQAEMSIPEIHYEKGSGRAAYVAYGRASRERQDQIDALARTLQSFGGLLHGDTSDTARASVRVLATGVDAAGREHTASVVVNAPATMTPGELEDAIHRAAAGGENILGADTQGLLPSSWHLQITSIVGYDNPAPSIRIGRDGEVER